jgi:large subunit ribosomal protein L2
MNWQKVSKRLKVILPKHSGRNSSGSITIRGQGGRQKRFYRLIDWQRDKHQTWAEVMSIEYDPNRSVNICLLKYNDGEFRYILHPIGLGIGDKVIAGEEAPIKVGCALPLSVIPSGVEIHNVELIKGRGGQIVRSAGSSTVIIGKDEKYAHLKLPSGEIRKVELGCYATIGKLDNENRKNENLGKAGRSRLLGKRPKVRGVAMNPNSHPHGGGEGRSGQGMHPKTPWGKGAVGRKTRQKTKSSNKLIIKRRKK